MENKKYSERQKDELRKSLRRILKEVPEGKKLLLDLDENLIDQYYFINVIVKTMRKNLLFLLLF